MPMYARLGTKDTVTDKTKLCRGMIVEKDRETVTIKNKEGETVFRAIKKSSNVWLCMYNDKFWKKPTILMDIDVSCNTKKS